MNAASPSPSIAIIGAGPAGLFAAEILSARGCRVQVFDRMPSVGRKLLMAGRSGLNLTHSEPLDRFLQRYGKAKSWLEPALRAFPPSALTEWAEGLGQSCFSGSSGRVFPTAMKASPLLRAWLRRLSGQGVEIHTRHRFMGWDDASVLFETVDGQKSVQADATVLTMGGASWSRLGSDGYWADLLTGETTPFAPANCGFLPDWPTDFATRHEGSVLHSVGLTFGTRQTRGDLTITSRGLEGSALYALSADLRESILNEGRAILTLDLRPTLSAEDVLKRLLSQRERESQTNRLRKALALDAASRELLRFATPKDASPLQLAQSIKSLPLPLIGMDALDRAISTAGGVRQEAVDGRFMLKSRPSVFVAGEMLDWEAPTGGYLLQGCIATGRMAGQGAWEWLRDSQRGRYPSAP